MTESHDYHRGYRAAMKELFDKIEAAEWPDVKVWRKPDMCDVSNMRYHIACRNSDTIVEAEWR